MTKKCRERKRNNIKIVQAEVDPSSILQYKQSLSTRIPNMNFLAWTVAENSYEENFLLNAWKERKKNKCKEEKQKRAGSLSHNTTCNCQHIPNINFLSNAVVEISLTKMWRERK